MIGEAVDDFKGIKHEAPAELKLELPIDAHIPATYVDSERLRLEAYHKLSAKSNGSNTRAELDAIKQELEDRYGVAPESVSNLIDVTELRQAANRMHLKDVLLIGQLARIAPVELTPENQIKLSHIFPNSRYLATAKTFNVPIPQNLSAREMIDWTWLLLKQIDTHKETND
jgi:transcription-repair coupling factor (superfamily II helicase)